METFEEHEDMTEFEKVYSIGHIMKASNAVPVSNDCQDYLGFTFHSRYQLNPNDQFSMITASVDYRRGLIDIYLPNGEHVDRPYELYKAINCHGDAILAKRWRLDSLLQRAKFAVQQALMAQRQALSQSQISSQMQSPAPTQVPIQSNFIESPPVQNFSTMPQSMTSPQNGRYPQNVYPYPTFDIDLFLDTQQITQEVPLQLCMTGPKFFAWDLAEELSAKTYVPFTSVMMTILGVFSGYTSKFWDCAYEFDGTSPISLYVCVEHPSGTKKTRILNTLLDPFSEMIQTQISMINKIIKSNKEKLDELNQNLAGCVDKFEKAQLKYDIVGIKNQLKKLEDQLKVLKGFSAVTNATPEALEKVLCDTNGYFLAASSEKGLINSLMGITYGKKHCNHDMLLNGRDGGNVNVERANRKSYYGSVVGSVVEFAQKGTILKIVSTSENIGLAERFCFVSEPDNIGRRDHTKNHAFDAAILEIYNKRTQFFKRLVELKNLNTHSPELDHQNRVKLILSQKSWQTIYHFENEFEKQLTVNGYLSHPIFKGMVSKIRMQVMSIACNLYILDLDNPPLVNKDPMTLVPDEYVSTAIQMLRCLIYHHREFLETYGIISTKQQIKVAYQFFLNRKDTEWLSMQQLKKGLEQVNPFKLLEYPRIAIENTIFYLANNYILLANSNRTEFKLNPNHFVFV